MTVPLTPSANGAEKQAKPKFVLNDEQMEYVEAALKAGTQTAGELAIVLMLAEVKDVPVMEMQKRWMDFKIGIRQVGLKVAHEKGIIISI